MDTAVDATRQVHAEERQVGVGHRIDQVADERGGARHQLVELAAERHDLQVVAHTVGRRHQVRLQPGAVHEHACVDVAAVGANGDRVRTLVDRDRPVTESNLGSRARDLRRQRVRDTREVDDAGLGDVQRGDTGDVRLQLAQSLVSDPFRVHAVGDRAFLELVEPRQLALVDRDDDLAALLERHVVLGAELLHLEPAAHAHRRLLRTGPVVDAGVQDAGVPTGLVLREARLLLEDRDVDAGTSAHDRACGGQPDDPAAHDQHVEPIGHARSPFTR